MLNSTVSSNTAAGDGGGIYHEYTIYCTNSIIAGNMATSGTNMNLRGTITAGTNNLIDVDPQLAPLGYYGGPTQTMPPLNGSPAIDPAGGDTTSSLSTDQRGYPRIGNGIVDIGAVENIDISPTSIEISSPSSGDGSSFEIMVSNPSGAVYQVLATTNLALPMTNWTVIGYPTESPPGSGQFHFVDTAVTNYPQRFYRVQRN